MNNHALIFAVVVAIGIAIAESVSADENVRAVQEKLRSDGFYSGEIDGAYSTDLSAALTRYQIRNGLPISGQLDAETSKALGAKPAVGPSTADAGQSSETWRRLRKGERQTSLSARRSQTAATEESETPPPGMGETPATAREEEAGSAPAGAAQSSSENEKPASPPPATGSTGEFGVERLRDYVAAFVLAGLDKNVGAEAEFFADHVKYYDSGVMNREKIREDLKRYDERWPERHFWLAGQITTKPESDNRVRVSFPLAFKLRNGSKQSSGKVDKTLVLQRAGDDLEIVAVNERKE